MSSGKSSVLPKALRIPGLNKLHGKRIILASGSPRRKEILETFVSGIAGLQRINIKHPDCRVL